MWWRQFPHLNVQFSCSWFFDLCQIQFLILGIREGAGRYTYNSTGVTLQVHTSGIGIINKNGGWLEDISHEIVARIFYCFPSEKCCLLFFFQFCSVIKLNAAYVRWVLRLLLPAQVASELEDEHLIPTQQFPVFPKCQCVPAPPSPTVCRFFLSSF